MAFADPASGGMVKKMQIKFFGVICFNFEFRNLVSNEEFAHAHWMELYSGRCMNAEGNQASTGTCHQTDGNRITAVTVVQSQCFHQCFEAAVGAPRDF